jgi:hypothetical protein
MELDENNRGAGQFLTLPSVVVFSMSLQLKENVLSVTLTVHGNAV